MHIFHDSAKQQFIYLDANQQEMGRLAYRFINEGKIDAYSTIVKPQFQGKGIAAALYQALIDFAQQQQLKIKPSCHYIETKMARSHPDMLA